MQMQRVRLQRAQIIHEILTSSKRRAWICLNPPQLRTRVTTTHPFAGLPARGSFCQTCTPCPPHCIPCPSHHTICAQIPHTRALKQEEKKLLGGWTTRFPALAFQCYSMSGSSGINSPFPPRSSVFQLIPVKLQLFVTSLQICHPGTGEAPPLPAGGREGGGREQPALSPCDGAAAPGGERRGLRPARAAGRGCRSCRKPRV